MLAPVAPGVRGRAPLPLGVFRAGLHRRWHSCRCRCWRMQRPGQAAAVSRCCKCGRALRSVVRAQPGAPAYPTRTVGSEIVVAEAFYLAARYCQCGPSGNSARPGTGSGWEPYSMTLTEMMLQQGIWARRCRFRHWLRCAVQGPHALLLVTAC